MLGDSYACISTFLLFVKLLLAVVSQEIAGLLVRKIELRELTTGNLVHPVGDLVN